MVCDLSFSLPRGLSLAAICQLPGVDVVDHGAEGVGVHVPDVDLSLPGLPHVGVQHGTEYWRFGAKKTFVNFSQHLQ